MGIESFKNILDRLANKFEDYQKSSHVLTIKIAVDLWCEELNIEPNPFSKDENSEFVISILEWLDDKRFPLKIGFLYKNDGPNIKRLDVNGIVDKTRKPMPDSVKRIITRLKNELLQKDDQMALKAFLIIGLILLGLAIVSSRLESKTTDKSPNKTNLPSNRTKASEFVAVFVVNVKHNKLIRTIESQSHLDQATAEDLYKATQALWFGSKNDYFRSRISECFLPNNKYISEQNSDYNVFLVQIQTSSYFAGLSRQSKNQLDRYDALIKLSLEDHKTLVSKLLISDSYGNTEFYNR